MFEDYLIEHCSPTLAGLKAANLFNYRYDSYERLLRDVNTYAGMLTDKGIEIKILSLKDNSALIYVFRSYKLLPLIKSPHVKQFLAGYGYESFSMEDLIERLSERISTCESFPHEIGVFLGYPIEDVKGFIKNAGQNCKCTGCWKVYCNECEAVRLFAKFNKCKRIYKDLFSKGRPVYKLTVGII